MCYDLFELRIGFALLLIPRWVSIICLYWMCACFLGTRFRLVETNNENKQSFNHIALLFLLWAHIKAVLRLHVKLVNPEVVCETTVTDPLLVYGLWNLYFCKSTFYWMWNNCVDGYSDSEYTFVWMYLSGIDFIKQVRGPQFESRSGRDHYPQVRNECRWWWIHPLVAITV